MLCSLHIPNGLNRRYEFDENTLASHLGVSPKMVWPSIWRPKVLLANVQVLIWTCVLCAFGTPIPFTLWIVEYAHSRTSIMSNLLCEPSKLLIPCNLRAVEELALWCVCVLHPRLLIYCRCRPVEPPFRLIINTHTQNPSSKSHLSVL